MSERNRRDRVGLMHAFNVQHMLLVKLRVPLPWLNAQQHV
jgi:hypothetical protein